jgi:hypothetical protein
MEVLDKIEAPRFDLHDMEMLGLFAKQASIAIAQSQQYDYIADMLVEGISTWVGEKAPEDIKPILEQLLDREGQADEIAELSQIAVALQELFQTGRAERKMALQVLEVVCQYLSERSSKFKY